MSGSKLESLVLWQLRSQSRMTVGGDAPAAPLRSWNLVAGVLQAFLPEIDIPYCAAHPNPAARARFIEKSISTQQPSIPIRDFLDLGSFEALSNVSRQLLCSMRKNVILPLEGYLRNPENPKFIPGKRSLPSFLVRAIQDMFSASAPTLEAPYKDNTYPLPIQPGLSGGHNVVTADPAPYICHKLDTEVARTLRILLSREEAFESTGVAPGSQRSTIYAISGIDPAMRKAASDDRLSFEIPIDFEPAAAAAASWSAPSTANHGLHGQVVDSVLHPKMILPDEPWRGAIGHLEVSIPSFVGVTAFQFKKDPFPIAYPAAANILVGPCVSSSPMCPDASPMASGDSGMNHMSVLPPDASPWLLHAMLSGGQMPPASPLLAHLPAKLREEFEELVGMEANALPQPDRKNTFNT